VPRGTCDRHFSPAALFGPLGPVAEPTRPGPQPANQVAATYADAMRRLGSAGAEPIASRKGFIRRAVGRIRRAWIAGDC
jgi:hypothetical protein